MQKGAGPDAAMDKANRNKMLSQGERTVGKGHVDEKQYKDAYGNCLGGNPNAQKRYIRGGRDKPSRGCSVQYHLQFQQEGSRGH